MNFSRMMFIVIVLRFGSIVAYDHDQPFEPRRDSRHSPGTRDVAYNKYTDHDTGQNGFTLSRSTRSDGSACEPCKCCRHTPCNTKTGYCSKNDCNRIDLVPPLCTRVLKPTKFKDIKDTTATALQEVDIPKDIAEYSKVVLQVQGEQHEKSTVIMTREKSDNYRSTYKATIPRLQPGTRYTVSTRLTIENQIPVGAAESRQDHFNTTGGALEIYDLLVRRTTDTSVTLKWKTRPKKVEDGYLYRISIETNQMIGCVGRRVTLPKVMERTSETNTIEIDNLHPYASYTAFVYPRVGERNRETAAQVNFNTSATDVATSVVSNLRYDARKNILRWEEPQDCTTITGPISGTELFFYSVGSKEPEVTAQSLKPFCRLVHLSLRANTTYHVRAHVIRSESSKHSDQYREIEFRTPSTARSHVTNARVDQVDSDTSTIILRWEPPEAGDNDIEFYKVLIIGRYDKFRRDPFKIEKEKRELNVTLPLNLKNLDIAIVIYAVNNRSQPQDLLGLSFNPVEYFTRPSKPLNLTHDYDNHGIVILKWNHPSISYISINQFDIQIEILETKLLDQRAKKFPIITVTYPVKESQPNYHKRLYLLSSTSYRISVTASNSDNLRSSQAQVDISVPAGCAFWNGEALRLTTNGGSIDVEVPGVENATENTMVTIFVEGYTKCATKQLSSQQSELRKWVVHEYQLETSKSQTSTIDPDHGAETNCSLRREEAYNITAVLRDKLGKLDELTSSSLTISDNSQQNNLVWMILIPIVAICLLPVVIWRIKRSKFPNRARPPSYLDIIPHSPTAMHVNNSTPRHSAHIYTIPNEPDSRAISIQHFEEYTKNANESGLLYSQFMLLRRGMTKPCETGMLPENIPKNRYRNLIAYDDTRVVLDKIPGDAHSDYINASYIRGYRKERAYIATQGPKSNTINDFWRMIWQEDVRVICMMSNVVEGVTKHSEKYWPDIESRIKYGNIFISNTNQQVFSDFTFREFKLSCDRDTRKVTHLQYTGWPVLGLPSAQSFVVFLKKLVQTPSGDGPIVVHCHAGDGRSGVIILCDISLRQAIGESTIDVTAVTTRMRDSRANMVATPQQYLFAHIAIIESLMSIPTQLPCTEIFTSRLQKMRLQLITDIQRLEDTMWQEQALDAFATQESSTAEYTTIDDIAEDISGVADFDRSRTFDRRSSAIHVVGVDGLRLKNQYLATWLPSPLTLANFWKFVAEENIQLIVILQCSDPKNATCSDIIPDELILPSMPHMTVDLKTAPENGEYFTSEQLLLTDTSERITTSRTVTVLTCGGWQPGEFGKPPAPVALVSLWRASEKIPRKEAETLVLCNNGSSGCRLYLAMCLLLERMAVEGECDVISAVRKVRKSNPGFVLSKNHCEYLYDAAEVYAEYFKCYANFI